MAKVQAGSKYDESKKEKKAPTETKKEENGATKKENKYDKLVNKKRKVEATGNDDSAENGC